MLLDLHDATDAVEHITEICIIGAGAAGITMARHLLAAGHQVTLLESGGLDYESAAAALNTGENIGQDYYDLEDARLRFFGGTTAIWGGRVAEFDPIDFEKRPWVPHSGWPIDWQTIAPYYAAARPLFGLPAEPPSPAGLAATGVRLPQFDETMLATRLWSFDRRFNRFTFDACDDLQAHPRCTIITHATVIELVPAASGRAITRIEARSLSGRRLTVHARAFVLSAGGLENPRLLLASRSLSPQGIGNDHDQVGRYFMEHPHARGGRIVETDAWMLLNAFARRHVVGNEQVAALIAPSERAQADLGILNTALTIVGRRPADAKPSWTKRTYNRIKHEVAPTRGGRALWMHTKKLGSFAQRRVDPLRPWLLHKLGRIELALLVRAEQAPDPSSRVTLSDDVDALGMLRLRLDWRLGELDKHSVERLVWALGREVERLKLGRVEPAAWLHDPSQIWRIDPLVSSHPIGGYHHMGTTRMSNDPKQGVTDAFGCVHGIQNLHIAGSSLFPTSGWANPTLTIVALALRTADHISKQIRDAGHTTPTRAAARSQSKEPYRHARLRQKPRSEQ